MPKVGWVEKTIFELEGIKVDFINNGRNVRSEVELPSNYCAINRTRNSAKVSNFIEKLRRQYPGYDFAVYNGNGQKARGNMLLGNLRDTYIDE